MKRQWPTAIYSDESELSEFEGVARDPMDPF